MTHERFHHRTQDLLSEVRDGFLILTINRQESYNAWTSALRDELARQLIAAETIASIHGVVLTGAGDKAFCSGQDLSELEEFSNGSNIASWIQRLTRCYDAVRAFSKPLVAALNGVAAGSGFQITQFCDYTVAHPGVRVGQTEVSSGLPSVFGTWLMWERVGRRAIELALQGRLMNAQEAMQLGFIQEIAEPGQVLDRSLLAVQRLARQPRLAYQLSKLANRDFDQERYANAMSMALHSYQQAFDSGAPQAEIGKFFERRAQRRKAVTAS
jgi:enoyl-CoA hydratase/carnithine racemase